MFEEKWITERRKKPWLKLSKNFAKLPLVPFVPQNGQNLTVSYTFAEKSTFQIPQNYDVGSFPSVMTLKFGTLRKVETLGIGVSKLLVAANVPIHRKIRLPL